MTVDVVYEVTGTGPLVVLLHELGENRRVWDPVVPSLAEQHTVVQVDLRGHGESAYADSYDINDYTADVQQVITQIAPEGVPILVGHGFGAFVAANYATLHPALAVIDLDQLYRWTDTYPLARAFPQEPTSDDLETVLLYPVGYGPLSPAEQDRIRSLRRVDREVLIGTWEPLLQGDPRGLRAWAEQILALPNNVPLTCVLGADPGKKYVNWMREFSRDTRVEGWDAGHYPHLVHPERFVELVRSQQQKPPRTGWRQVLGLAKK